MGIRSGCARVIDTYARASALARPQRDLAEALADVLQRDVVVLLLRHPAALAREEPPPGDARGRVEEDEVGDVDAALVLGGGPLVRADVVQQPREVPARGRHGAAGCVNHDG